MCLEHDIYAIYHYTSRRTLEKKKKKLSSACIITHDVSAVFWDIKNISPILPPILILLDLFWLNYRYWRKSIEKTDIKSWWTANRPQVHIAIWASMEILISQMAFRNSSFLHHFLLSFRFSLGQASPSVHTHIYKWLYDARLTIVKIH